MECRIRSGLSPTAQIISGNQSDEKLFRSVTVNRIPFYFSIFFS